MTMLNYNVSFLRTAAYLIQRPVYLRRNSLWVAVRNQLWICSNPIQLKLLKGSKLSLPGRRIGNVEILIKVVTYILETLVLVQTGKIVTVTGPVSFVIALNDGRFIRRHVDHIRKKFDVETPDIPIVPASVVPCTTPLRMDIPDREETREESSAESKLNSAWWQWSYEHLHENVTNLHVTIFTIKKKDSVA